MWPWRMINCIKLINWNRPYHCIHHHPIVVDKVLVVQPLVAGTFYRFSRQALSSTQHIVAIVCCSWVYVLHFNKA